MQNRTRDLDALFQDGVLIDLQVGYWQARAANTTRDLGIERSKKLLPDYVAGLGTKRLVDKFLTDQWANYANRARYAITKRSFEFPIGNHRFIPMGALAAAEAELNEIKNEFDSSVDYLVRHYDEIRERTLSKSEKHRKALAGHYPAKKDLRGKFHMTWTAFTIALPRRARVEVAKRERIARNLDARAKAEILRQRERALAETRYREALEQRVETFLSEAVNTLRTKAVDICATVADKIRSGEVVTDRSLNQLRRFVDQFAMMNFVGDDDVEKRLAKLKKEVLEGRSASAFADDEVMRQRLATSLDAIQAAATDVSDVSGITGDYKRRILVG